ncbi:gag-pol polyprotein [Trichonephila clavata]|uniref:Gag-pol polyprotein n=1 Tax=Trichonephila clavata TaxID=2740835 RepID=A0A8X6H059_TRICU|nr:gag-pol polyprotein [Trichonephila clavata]
MTYGLRNASQTFQRFMNTVLSGLDFLFCYLNDILIASADEETHKKHLRILFYRLDECGLCINPPKCLFGASQISFLGHKITSNGLKPVPEKVEVIRNVPEPKSATRLL